MSTLEIPNNDEDQLAFTLRQEGIPAHLHGGILRYVIQGIRPGGFLCSCIAMNTTEAVMRAADQHTKEAIPKITTWFLTVAPPDCCGSPENLEQWIRTKLEQRKAKP